MIHIVIISHAAHGGDISAVFSSPDAAVAHDYAKQLPAELNDAEAEVLVISCPANMLVDPTDRNPVTEDTTITGISMNVLR